MFGFGKSSLPPEQQQPQQPADDIPWWLKTGAKAVGSVAGVALMICGIFTAISIHLSCILAGVLMVAIGIAVTFIESPCFFGFSPIGQWPTQFMNRQPHWLRATIYLVAAGTPFFMCVGFASFVGCGLLVLTSGLYLLMVLGKKASVEEMRQRAGDVEAPTSGSSALFPPSITAQRQQQQVNNGFISASPSANLVENEQMPKESSPPPYVPQPTQLQSGLRGDPNFESRSPFTAPPPYMTETNQY